MKITEIGRPQDNWDIDNNRVIVKNRDHMVIVRDFRATDVTVRGRDIYYHEELVLSFRAKGRLKWYIDMAGSVKMNDPVTYHRVTRFVNDRMKDFFSVRTGKYT